MWTAQNQLPVGRHYCCRNLVFPAPRCLLKQVHWHDTACVLQRWLVRLIAKWRNREVLRHLARTRFRVAYDAFLQRRFYYIPRPLNRMPTDSADASAQWMMSMREKWGEPIVLELYKGEKTRRPWPESGELLNQSWLPVVLLCYYCPVISH